MYDSVMSEHKEAPSAIYYKFDSLCLYVGTAVFPHCAQHINDSE